MTTNIKIKTPFHSLFLNFSKCFQIIKKTWVNLILAIFFTLSLVLAISIISILIYYLLRHFNFVNENNFFTFRLIWNGLGYLIFMAVAAFAQILIINNLLNTQTDLKTTLKSVKIVFPSFFCLTIIINIIFFILTIPIYVAIFLFMFNNLILGVLSFILGIILILFAATYLIFSPFILIEKKKNCLAALKESFSLSKGKEAKILFKIIILALILVILNWITVILTPFYIIGAILSSIVFILMILFVFAYLLTIYQEIKKIKNV